jgi:hypothetical protein
VSAKLVMLALIRVLVIELERPELARNFASVC